MISVCMAGVPLLWALYAILMLIAGVQVKLVRAHFFVDIQFNNFVAILRSPYLCSSFNEESNSMGVCACASHLSVVPISLYSLPLRATQVLLYVFWCPFFSYLSVIATEAGMVDLKDLKPHLLQLMVAKGEMAKLMDQRKSLQQEVRKLVKQYGPDMGGAYYDRSVSWNSLANSNKERALSSDKDNEAAASSSGKAPVVHEEK
jgi:hypothetical protein